MRHFSSKLLWGFVGACACLPVLAQSLRIEQVTPQGAVQEVRQVVVQMSADAVRLGNPQATPPVRVECSDAADVPGSGRWNQGREWVWQWDRALPAGARCTVSVHPAFRSLTGQSLAPNYRSSFEVAGPSVIQTWPSRYEAIDERQAFVLQWNGATVPASVREHVYCQAADIGERIPVKLWDAATTATLVQSLGITERGHFLALECQRRLTAGSSMQLVVGAGVQMPSGVRSTSSERMEFQVRDAFTAELQCQRERANAGCLPIRDVVLSFTAPIAAAQAKQVHLLQQGKKVEAQLQEGSQDAGYSVLRFVGPFAARSTAELVLPDSLRDDGGRVLANAASFPMKVAFGDTPPLFKFAASPFGVLERFAEGPEGVAVLPVTARYATPSNATSKAHQGALRQLRLQEDADIIAWWDRLQRYNRSFVSRQQARRELQGAIPPPVDERDAEDVATRTVSLLGGRAGVEVRELPSAPSQSSEVIGIALPQAGFYVLEAESSSLGAALLDEALGTPRSMFVRTSVLVTNLAVHFKQGQEGSAVWVTSLDKGQAVAGAHIQVSDCRGKVHAMGRSDAQGVLMLPALGKDAPHCDAHEASQTWFVSARVDQHGDQDMAFVWSDWSQGIESWRFNVPTAWGNEAALVAHSVMDRDLVRAGETVSMKHFVRAQNLQGLTLPKDWPVQVRITHVGSNQQYQLPLQWTRHSATSSFHVPPAAKLGLYQVELRWATTAQGGERSVQSGAFRVEAFRLPVFAGRVQPVDSTALVQPKQIPVAVQLQYLNGGAAAGQTVQVSALLRERSVEFERWSGYSFRAPRAQEAKDNRADGRQEDGSDGARLVADKLIAQLDAQGQAQVAITAFPTVQVPQNLVLEASFSDPNGEVQTLRSTHSVWPASVLAGLRTEGWMSVGRKMRLQALAVNAQGQPQASVPLKVSAVQHMTTTTRKRLVGGFYSYDNQSQRKDLGQVCSGKSDARGLLLCEVQVVESGEVELIVHAEDGQGRVSHAADTVWVSGQGELWFGGQDHDRMDVLLEKEAYAPGETAKLQVRMPFREATALVSVEREGVLQTQLVQLQGKDPSIELPIQAGWGPNVYVSVLALRGRLYEVPWYSFFTWGYKAPRQWWHAFRHGGQEYVAPTAMVDLSKPAFRLGVVELKVHDKSKQLSVAVQADRSSYQVREKARVRIQVTLPDGQAAAHAEVAVAAVDKALLELSPNRSWDLRAAMWPRRAWAVDTATAQMEVVGRRHYGRKAAAPGGGGGSGAPTRELLDTLLLWQPRVQLDGQGQATVEVPLNDALTSFEVVAIADDGVDRFGSGSTELRTTQDLQLISGLPPVVREGDQFTAMVTVRNTTQQAMHVVVEPAVHGLTLSPQRMEIAAQQSQQLQWPVQVPALPSTSHGVLQWRIQAKDRTNGAQDALAFSQRVQPAVPLAVQQATLAQIDSHWEQALSWPEHALPGRGGVRLVLSDQLADATTGVPGLRDWWAAYPYGCLEQTVGKALGMQDAALWAATMAQLPTYLDSDGLALYFPPQAARHAQGSDALTAHLLALHHSQQGLAHKLVLPAAEKAQMEAGLIAFVEGRVERQFWSPRKDLDVRKLAAIAALAGSGKAQPSMLQSLQITPQTWPTHALLDWLTILRAMPQLPNHSGQLEQAQQQLRSRLSYQGSQLTLSTDRQDQWWWLMHNTDSNVARLLLLTVGDPAWDVGRARLVAGLLARQKQGAWSTTVANTWAGLALRQFSQRYESEAVTGNTTALLGATTRTVDWAEVRAASASASPHAAQQAGTASGPTASTASSTLPVGSAELDVDDARSMLLPWGERRMGQLSVQHRGTGKPWMALQSLAAVPRTEAVNAGYVVRKTVLPLQGADAQQWRRGDLVRVRLQIQASAPMAWVALNDPIPAGATIMGSGLGRDSVIAESSPSAEKAADGGAPPDSGAEPIFVERGQDSWRGYWDYLPQGSSTVEYTLRLNNAGDFGLPPTRVEALYAPEMFGESPNARWKVGGAQSR